MGGAGNCLDGAGGVDEGEPLFEVFEAGVVGLVLFEAVDVPAADGVGVADAGPGEAFGFGGGG